MLLAEYWPECEYSAPLPPVRFKALPAILQEHPAACATMAAAPLRWLRYGLDEHPSADADLDAQIMPVQEQHPDQRGGVRCVGQHVSWLAVPQQNRSLVTWPVPAGWLAAVTA